MECPLCGELCTCAAGRGSFSGRDAGTIPSHVAVLIDPESLDRSEQSFEDSLDPSPAPAEPARDASVAAVPLNEVAGMLAREAATAELETPVAVAVSELPAASSAAPTVASAPGPFYRPEESSAWRQEVTSRVDNFRTRRRGRFDPNSSLSLNFDESYETAPQPQAQLIEQPKIIEFPKPVAAPPVVEELAEPVVEKPRILEAEEPPEEEVAAPVAAPAVASITLEPSAAEVVNAYGQQQEVLLWIAPPTQRIFAGLVDGLIVATATGLFGLLFLQMSGAAPSGRMSLGVALALPGLFWALYQYIFLVYGGTTPGLQMTGLRLTSFDGNPVPSRVRQWRALAMILSYLSLGLGFLWAMVDEDGLCWHDRITRTCVRE